MLIAMAVWDTEENQRTEMTVRTIESLLNRINLSKHRVVISDNASCWETQDVYARLLGAVRNFTVIKNTSNLGTARAINKAWKLRQPGEHAVKMDNDVIVHYNDWPDEMEEVFARDIGIGICGLKRKDCEEKPQHTNPWFVSKLDMLPHQPGQRWMVVEEVQHVMGTCQAYSSACLDKIGYLYQMGGLYGFDDALASARAQVAGFRTVFIPYINIDHIDPGGTEYTHWKQKYSGAMMDRFFVEREEIKKTGKVYYGEDA